MSTKTAGFLVAIVLAAFAAGGCDFFNKMRLSPKKRSDEKSIIPPHVAGTIAQYSSLFGGGDIGVQGYGVIVGLGKSGSKEVPPHLEKYLSKFMLRKHVGSYRMGTEAVSPRRLLRDLDTAVVLLGAAIPPGAPIGSSFDVFVVAPPPTQTQSLAGGILMPTEMHLAWLGVAH